LGIAVIFFLQGLSLPTSELSQGFRPKRLHAFIIGWNYLLFPVCTGLLLVLGRFVFDPAFILGFWLLAILPTTVSSAVAFTAVSGGDTSKAIFATVLSNLLAVFVVPTVATTYFSVGSGVSIPLGPLLSKLALLIIAPLLVGQVVRKWLPEKAAAVSKRTKSVGNWIIIFIVHAAFARSVASGFMSEISFYDTVTVVTGTCLLLCVVSAGVWFSSKWIRPSPEERISGFFCASQKSIATGLPMATMIFAAIPESINTAAALIPLMCYHPLQLVLAGFLGGHWSQQKENT
jgi:sodium/bile acid cotransporter 7